ncbi:unnamed protein product [Linum tenue]|uniref:Uncharacterized protein n=1 Tax=Linum tenue TaxID=586396 RepID=A0AAV0H4H8_9ROSI|nr:unnamed protein product [Linum tenue]
MAATPVPESADGPVLSLINKRLRALRKKQNRIIQMEESVAQGKALNNEQREVLRSKPSVSAAIDELEKLRQPLSVAVSEEIELAIQRHRTESQPSPDVPAAAAADVAAAEEEKSGETERREEEEGSQPEAFDSMVGDLLNLLYFGALFDVKSQNDFTATMLSRTHERGCCLTYDYVTDDATDLLSERDLDMISTLSGLLISRPVDSSLSHKNALQRCVEHAKLWLANADCPVDDNAGISYAGLRERLNKIMASDYFTTSPERKASAEVAAAAAAGNYVHFQVPVHGMPIAVPVQVESHSVDYQPQVFLCQVGLSCVLVVTSYLVTNILKKSSSFLSVIGCMGMQQLLKDKMFAMIRQIPPRNFTRMNPNLKTLKKLSPASKKKRNLHLSLSIIISKMPNLGSISMEIEGITSTKEVVAVEAVVAGVIQMAVVAEAVAGEAVATKMVGATSTMTSQGTTTQGTTTTTEEEGAAAEVAAMQATLTTTMALAMPVTWGWPRDDGGMVSK